jgi:hypothetical protein
MLWRGLLLKPLTAARPFSRGEFRIEFVVACLTNMILTAV